MEQDTAVLASKLRQRKVRRSSQLLVVTILSSLMSLSPVLNEHRRPDPLLEKPPLVGSHPWSDMRRPASHLPCANTLKRS